MYFGILWSNSPHWHKCTPYPSHTLSRSRLKLIKKPVISLAFHVTLHNIHWISWPRSAVTVRGLSGGRSFTGRLGSVCCYSSECWRLWKEGKKRLSVTDMGSGRFVDHTQFRQEILNGWWREVLALERGHTFSPIIARASHIFTPECVLISHPYPCPFTQNKSFYFIILTQFVFPSYIFSQIWLIEFDICLGVVAWVPAVFNFFFFGPRNFYSRVLIKCTPKTNPHTFIYEWITQYSCNVIVH